MLKRLKILVISFFCLLMITPQFLAGGEIDSLQALLTETHDAVTKIEIYTLLSKKYQQVDIGEAGVFAREALKLSENTGHEDYLGEIYALLGDIAVMQDSLNLAKSYYETAMEVLESQDDMKGLTRVTLVLGNIAFVQDKLPEALQYYHTAVDYATESGLDNLLDNLYLNIGSINYRIKNIQGAQEYYTKALESFLRSGDSLNIADAYANLGLTYVDLSNYNLAGDYFNNALKIYLGLKAYINSARTYMYMAIAEKNKHNYNQAINFLFLGLEYLEKKDDTYSGPRQTTLSQIYSELGANYLALKDFQKAGFYYTKGHKLGLSNGQLSIITKTAKGLAELWENKNQLDSALFYQKIYKTFSDSMINEENIKKLAYQDAQFEYEQLLIAEKLEREKETEIQKRNKLLFIAIIVGLVMLLLVLILFLKLGRNKIKRVELEQETLKKELELRNKELTTHVLYQVKNNEFILNLSKKLKIALSNIMPENRSKINEVIREIEMDSSQETWKEFELRFQNVHTGFYKKLSNEYPDLTSNELRICAFLKLNMSTKDIAAITYQTTNSITVARWRLRQKFGLDKDANLVSFLSQY